jgi:hypothetical protein
MSRKSEHERFLALEAARHHLADAVVAAKTSAEMSKANQEFLAKYDRIVSS